MRQNRRSMRIFKAIIFTLTLLSPMILYSQEHNLTLEDLIPGGKNYNKYRIEMPISLSWHGEDLTYLKGDTMYIAPKKDGNNPIPYLTLDQINNDMGLTGKERLQKMVFSQWLSSESNNLLVRTYNKTYIYNVETKTVVATFNVSHELENYDFSPSFLNAYIQYMIPRQTTFTFKTPKVKKLQ